ncbi:MAG TPA: AMP-binding protein [Myxococcaceae bacterium]|nr:AMP-binding protein [Myxococcaceae bacterium]
MQLSTRLSRHPAPAVLWAEGASDEGLLARAEKWARTLRLAGLSRGARLVSTLANGPDFAGALVACWEMGVTFVPLSPTLAPEERRRRIDAVRAAAVLGPQGVVPEAPGAQIPPDPTDRAAVILFTSGSQGDARPVALSEAALVHVAETHAVALGMGEGVRVLGYLPWSHAFGFTLELLASLLCGAHLRYVPPSRFPQALAEGGADFLFTVPRMLGQTDSAALRTLAGGIVGGAPVRGALRQCLSRTRLRVGYGQTECGPGVTLGGAGEWEEDDFLGRPVGCQVELGAADEGDARELCVRGSNLALGYLDDGRVVPLAQKNASLPTGDLVTPTADGGFTFQGRRDELFKLDNGRMVNPVPLERPFDGRILLVSGRHAVQPLARGVPPHAFDLPLPHLKPLAMPESFWEACTTPTGKVSRARAQQLFDQL